ncbi:hypothetical protein [Gloeocapsa sp. PCC 73106]|uniref:hypothetical protein n=1 Tax=Gloeocapsa sp. PCC 73106 TaxID=102232 RepID=UPI0002AC6894|nr:hypothetical protein [Gloeocapsa sp. PCC 73106]ELR98779.1 uncharacterized protein involved in stress response [Gloeocapsa sp. PCC 73106]
MVSLKAKTVLNQKGEEAFIALKELTVTLKWSASVDLDLMAFYKAKDGRTGAVVSDNYPGGNLGNLNEFPYIQLSGDEGVGATGGDNEEVLMISRLDDLAEVYVCTINYTDAIAKKDSSFSKHDGGIIVMDEQGETIGVPLNSEKGGQVAVIARIDNTNPIGAKLINENRIITLEEFASTIPGAEAIVE